MIKSETVFLFPAVKLPLLSPLLFNHKMAFKKIEILLRYPILLKVQLDSQEAEKNNIIAALEVEKSELVELQKNNESEIKVLREKADSSENLVCVFLFNLPFHQLLSKTKGLIFNILEMTFFIYSWRNLNKKSSVYWMKCRANNRLVIC